MGKAAPAQAKHVAGKGVASSGGGAGGGRAGGARKQQQQQLQQCGAAAGHRAQRQTAKAQEGMPSHAPWSVGEEVALVLSLAGKKGPSAAETRAQ